MPGPKNKDTYSKPDFLKDGGILKKIKDVIKKGLKFVKEIVKDGIGAVGTAAAGLSVRVLGGKESYKEWTERNNTIADAKDIEKGAVGNVVACRQGNYYVEGTIKSFTETKEGREYQIDLCDGRTVSLTESDFMTKEYFNKKNKEMPDGYQKILIDADALKKYKSAKEHEIEKFDDVKKSKPVTEKEKADEEVHKESKYRVAETIEEARNGDFAAFVQDGIAREVKVIDFQEHTALINDNGIELTVNTEDLYGNKEIPHIDADISNLSDSFFYQNDGRETNDKLLFNNFKKVLENSPIESDYNFTPSYQSEPEIEAGLDYVDESDIATPLNENTENKYHFFDNDEVIITEGEPFTLNQEEKTENKDDEHIMTEEKQTKNINIPEKTIDMQTGDHVLYSYKGKFQEATVTAINKKSIEIELNDGREYTIKKAEINKTLFGFDDIKSDKVMAQCVKDENNTKFSSEFRDTFKDMEAGKNILSILSEDLDSLDDLETPVFNDDLEPIALSEQMSDARNELDTQKYTQTKDKAQDVPALEDI